MKIKISYLYFIYLILLIRLNLIKPYSMFYLCVLAHELGHLIGIRAFNASIYEIYINICGIGIKYNEQNLNKKNKITIYILGPFTNFMLAFLCSNNVYLCYINIALGVFNLIPIMPLDGGRIMSVINPKNYKNIENISLIMMLSIISVLAIDFSNIMLLFSGIYIIQFCVNINNLH